MIFVALLAATIGAGDACAPEALKAPIETAIQAHQKGKLADAKAAIESAAACPVKNGPTFLAHILRADIAVKEADWTTARLMLDGVGVLAETPLSVLAGAIRLRTDQALKDEAAFTKDRDALIAGNTAMLTRLGKPIETFRAGKAQVYAFQATVQQGVFKRALEFIIVPDNPTAYPQSILVTDDLGAAAVDAELSKDKVAHHIWFVDGYRCGTHHTITMGVPSDPSGQPSYAVVRETVVKSVSETTFTPEVIPDKQVCWGFGWILPGLGARPPVSP